MSAGSSIPGTISTSSLAAITCALALPPVDAALHLLKAAACEPVPATLEGQRVTEGEQSILLSY